jgi:hypothetical protein
MNVRTKPNVITPQALATGIESPLPDATEQPHHELIIVIVTFLGCEASPCPWSKTRRRHLNQRGHF